VKKTKPRLQAQPPLEFVYRGTAVAAGGFLTKLNGKPQETNPNTPTTHGESCLPLVGGVSRSAVDPKLPFPEFIRYGVCETFVWGRRVRDATVTTLTASVSKVSLRTGPSPEDNVPDVKAISFEADRFAIEVEARHPQEGQPSFVLKKAEAVGMGLIVTRKTGENIRTPIELEWNKAVISMTTMTHLEKAFLTKRTFFDQHVSLWRGRSAPVFGKSTLPKTAHGFFAGSFVKSIRLGDQVVKGNVLTTKGFGTITFGLMLADEVSRRLSIARIKMGSDPGADLGFSGVETNGIWREN